MILDVAQQRNIIDCLWVWDSRKKLAFVQYDRSEYYSRSDRVVARGIPNIWAGNVFQPVPLMHSALPAPASLATPIAHHAQGHRSISAAAARRTVRCSRAAAVSQPAVNHSSSIKHPLHASPATRAARAASEQGPATASLARAQAKSSVEAHVSLQAALVRAVSFPALESASPTSSKCRHLPTLPPCLLYPPSQVSLRPHRPLQLESPRRHIH